MVMRRGFPSMLALLLAEISVLPVVELGHLLWSGYKRNGSFSLRGVVNWGEAMTWRRYAKWALGGALTAFVLYSLCFPLGLLARNSLFAWLPEWYFDPGFDQFSKQALTIVAFIAIASDGWSVPSSRSCIFAGICCVG